MSSHIHNGRDFLMTKKIKVLSVNRQIGTFLDWGLSKDLLLPFREQTFPLRPGQRVVVFVCLDPKTDRIVATARLNRHLVRTQPTYRTGQVVNLMIVDRTPLGYNALVEREHMGLLFANNLPAPLEIGKQLKGFVRTVHPSGGSISAWTPPATDASPRWRIKS